ncbi:MAG: DUF362 domain-containing protein [archaeon]|jgi:uncharacterized protein (DUF362 family)|nr:DUF362 domain-containing protein [archaeon]
MAKGISIKFRSYPETLSSLLKVINLEKELKKHSKIVLKPYLALSADKAPIGTSIEFVEEVLKFCLRNKNPVAEVFIAEGVDGGETMELFEALGYTKLAEKYSVGLLDLNNAETETIEFANFLKFSEIKYPRVLKESFVISLPKLMQNDDFAMLASLSNMLGAFPAKHYTGWFAKNKSKIRKWPLKYSIHDITQCKSPDFAIIDASEKGAILAGLPLDMDKQAAKLIGMEWKNVGYLRLAEEYPAKPLERPADKIVPAEQPAAA